MSLHHVRQLIFPASLHAFARMLHMLCVCAHPPAGCSGSQLAAAAAAAGTAAAGAGAGSNDSSATALAHLEAVLDHARNKGRHVLLVNCPGMAWEPTTRECRWNTHAVMDTGSSRLAKQASRMVKAV